MSKRETINRAIGSRIREARRGNKWTLKDLAKKAGLSVGFLSDVENGKRGISAENLFGIAAGLGKPLSWFASSAPSFLRATDPHAWVNWDDVLCEVHNHGAGLVGNTEGTDVEWLAQWLWMHLSCCGRADAIENETFAAVGLVPDRAWTRKPRWENMTPAEQARWRQLAAACIEALPRLCERVGRRYMDWEKATKNMGRVLTKERAKGEA